MDNFDNQSTLRRLSDFCCIVFYLQATSVQISFVRDKSSSSLINKNYNFLALMSSLLIKRTNVKKNVAVVCDKKYLYPYFFLFQLHWTKAASQARASHTNGTYYQLLNVLEHKLYYLLVQTKRCVTTIIQPNHIFA